MDEYITKKQAQDILCRGCNKDLHLICRCDKWAEIRKIDGIDIVHCKECKYYEGSYCNGYNYDEYGNLRFVDDNFFCADGERRTE